MVNLTIETHIVPNKQAVLFLKDGDDVIWERYWIDHNKLIDTLITVADLVRTLDSHFKEKGDE